jgi:deoxyribodipyrimidine photo-lyase
MVPELRIRTVNEAAIRPGGRFVLYWMVAHRRLRWNFALQRACEEARRLRLPLMVFEPLRAGHRWASARFHQFVLQGMRDHAEALRRGPARYLPYVEPEPGAGKGLLRHLAEGAALVVTDDYPAFFLPGMVRSAGEALDVRLEAVDSNGLLPIRAPEREFTTAYSFRRGLQKMLPAHLLQTPEPDPLGNGLPEWPGGAGADPLRLPSLAGPAGASEPGGPAVRWKEADLDRLLSDGGLSGLPIDLDVGPTALPGGPVAARRALVAFVEERLHRYGEDRNHPDRVGGSGLSPWLHWGHLSPHEVFDAVAGREGWTPLRLADRADGKRHGWWGMSESTEAFLDELVTWREIGFNTCVARPDDYFRYTSLPEWARTTLAEHAEDARPHLYDLERFDAAETHDPLWNAAQRQLRGEGVIHNYLRMLWGKKILEWSPSPEAALDVMIELNNRYALDGRDPNSWSGIFWVLGRYDRGWPERPVYGKVRSMSSDSTRRKVDLNQYLERYGL